MALTLRGSGQVSADNYGIDSDGSITATGKSFIKNNNSYATSSQTSYDNASFRLDNLTGGSSIGTSFGVITPNVNYIQSGYNEGTTAPLTLNPYGGKVGIGTSSPNATLTVSQSGNNIFAVERTGISGSSGQFGINIEGNSQTTVSYDDGAPLVFGTASSPSTHTGFTERMKIDASGYVTTPNQPSFRAGRNGNYIAGYDNDIVFNLTSGTQLFNIGSHYSTSTGLFTAPVSGSYIFHVVIIWGPSMPEGEDMADSFRLVYNGTKFHYSERRAEYVNGSTGNGGYYVDHATCIARMNANDTIGVRSQETQTVHGNAQYTTFAGHKIG